MENKVTTEFAEKEFNDWVLANDFEKDLAVMSKELQDAYLGCKKAFISAMKAGRLVVDGTSLVYTVSKFSPQGFAGEEIKIARPSGNIWLAFDGRKNDGAMHKLQSSMSAMVGKDIAWFSKLDVKDWNFFAMVVSVFLS